MTQIAPELTCASLMSDHWQAGTIWFLIYAKESRIKGFPA